MQTIAEVMTKFPYSIDGDARLRAGKCMMEQYHIHHMPVKTENGYDGLITDRDIGFAADLGVMDSDKILIANVCRHDAHVVGPETPLADVLVYLAESNDDAVLIVESDKLIGIFTTTDVCRCYAEQIKKDS